MNHQEDNNLLQYLKNPTCKFFTGYKPCPVATKHNTTCPSVYCRLITDKLLVIEMGGLGSILRTTVVTKEFKKRHENAHITFLTNTYGAQALTRSPSVDRVLVYDSDILPLLLVEEFNYLYNYEVNPLASSLTSLIKAKSKYGFGLNKKGLPYLLNDEAFELYRLQVDNTFRQQNKKSIQQLLLESVGIKWKEQQYDISLKQQDLTFAEQFIINNNLQNKKIIGLNIGCRKKHALKRWPIDYFIALAKQLSKRADTIPLIVGGTEEIAIYEYAMRKLRKQKIIGVGCDTTVGEYFALINKCDVFVSATTFGLLAAIGMGKKTVAICSPKPMAEIYNYSHGIKVTETKEYNPLYSTKISLKDFEEEKETGLKNISVEFVYQAIEDALHDDFSHSERYVNNHGVL